MMVCCFCLRTVHWLQQHASNMRLAFGIQTVIELYQSASCLSSIAMQFVSDVVMHIVNPSKQPDSVYLHPGCVKHIRQCPNSPWPHPHSPTALTPIGPCAPMTSEEAAVMPSVSTSMLRTTSWKVWLCCVTCTVRQSGMQP